MGRVGAERSPSPPPSPSPAEHEGPVSWVCISPDGLRVLSATLSGHLGFLDVPSREYNTLARSHTAPVLALATECSRGQLATMSQDHTVRVWDLATLQQVGCGQKGGMAERGGPEGCRPPWGPVGGAQADVEHRRARGA